ncbi:MAG TPA: PSD1 and planctomycete cytochrome C domain-containing protein [Gemmataceae bacterium]|nr:PSD1 and planctomycete cytochrome C domain-containing protein [Gemmataceae bacterium]
MPTRFALAAASVFLAASSAAAQKVDYARDVLPILSDNCFACHGPDEKARKAKLRLDIKTDTETVVPGKSGESELIRRVVSGDAAEVMPPPKSNKKLTAAQIATLKKWIDDGAAWGTHWSFVKPTRPPVPTIPNRKIANPIDAFVLARLDREQLSPSPEASKDILIRRVTLDLTGLPPTAAEVDAFLKDTSANAYEKVVDRLLASPRYGERMAWDWLDAARYADSNGYQGDGERTMWPWRDWVVRAFNENLPYDQFTVWQLAGDQLPKPTQEQILATGFNRNHMINGEGGRIAEENRVEYVFDQTETTGTVWLGLTLTCCRCHDHKFDPIAKKDYFRFFAFFNQTPVNGGGGSGQTTPVIDFGTPEMEAKRKAAASAYDELFKVVTAKEAKLREAGMVKNKDGKYETSLPQLIESALRKGPNDRADQNFDELVKFYKDKEPEYAKQLGELRKRKQARDAAANAIPKVMVMADMPKPRDTFMLTRGAYDKPEDKVTAGVPAWLGGEVGKTPNRLALANWVVSPENPLTARVTVNRVWQQFFGTGLVKTTEDFGVQGERPSHPELLDWLAVGFMASRASDGTGDVAKNPPVHTGGSPWDMKRLVRLIVTSATYRQSARVTPELRERDPENRLLARASRYRLPSWTIRDQALAASGLMTPTIGGPPVKPYQPAGIWEEATFGNKRYTPDKGEALYRRSLYVFWRRIVGPTMFFDTANRQTCTVKNVVTNTPLHALATLNDITFVEAARVLAQKAMKQDGDRLAFAFRSLLARSPSDAELKVLKASLEKQRKLFAADKPAAEKLLKVGDSPRDNKLDAVEHAALTAVCLLLLNLDEVLTRQ